MWTILVFGALLVAGYGVKQALTPLASKVRNGDSVIVGIANIVPADGPGLPEITQSTLSDLLGKIGSPTVTVSSVIVGQTGMGEGFVSTAPIVSRVRFPLNAVLLIKRGNSTIS